MLEFMSLCPSTPRAARAVLNRLAPSARTLDVEVEKALDQEMAVAEAKLCLSCGRAFEANRTCWFCLPCEIECPADAFEVRMPYLVR